MTDWSNHHVVQSAVNTMNTWATRRAANGKLVTEDMIRHRIVENWPTMDDTTKETVLQCLKMTRHTYDKR